jgi:hypothetical protein
MLHLSFMGGKNPKNYKIGGKIPDLKIGGKTAFKPFNNNSYSHHKTTQSASSFFLQKIKIFPSPFQSNSSKSVLFLISSYKN